MFYFVLNTIILKVILRQLKHVKPDNTLIIIGHSSVCVILTRPRDVAVSSQGMQDHFGAKSANWLAMYRNCQSCFQVLDPRPGRTLQRG